MGKVKKGILANFIDTVTSIFIKGEETVNDGRVYPDQLNKDDQELYKKLIDGSNKDKGISFMDKYGRDIKQVEKKQEGGDPSKGYQKIKSIEDAAKELEGK